MPDAAASTDAASNHAALLNRAAALVGIAVSVLLVAVLAGWTGPDNPSALWAAIDTLIRALPVAGLWLAAAIGFGWPARMLLFPHTADGLLLQTACGVGVLLWLDASLGAAGLLFIGGATAAWIITALGLLLLGWQLKNHLRLSDQSSFRPYWLWWAAAPAVAVLITASTSAPGWLWTSEFGGYDALSYHLQLPREWIAAGRIAPSEHNVYSFLPGYVEAAFTHIALLRGDAHDAAYACQLLHACMAILTAITVCRCVLRFTDANLAPTLPATMSGVLLLGTPWVIVTGSLAYNELFVAFMLAAGLLALTNQRIDGARLGIVIGLLAGAACGAKLTAVGFAAAPLGIVLIITRRDRLATTILFCAIAGFIMLAPWLARNLIACSNPVFPFLTGLFGQAHWSADQVAAWSRGHFIEGGIPARIATGFDQFFRYGIGPNADPTGFEPWKPQWLILPWLGLLAFVIGMIHPTARRWSVLLAIVFLVQLVFWLGFTHIKSRFMLPSVVPLTIMIGVAMHVTIGQIQRSSIAAILAAFAGIIWCATSALIYRSEADGWPSLMLGNHRLWTGEGIPRDEQRAHAMTSSPVLLVNHVLPPESQVLLIGDAKPYYYALDRITYQTTWDRGPMSQIIRAHPDQPSAWVEALRARGYSHVLIDTAMLERWRASGWGDPLLDPQQLSDAFGVYARPVADYGNVRVYAL